VRGYDNSESLSPFLVLLHSEIPVETVFLHLKTLVITCALETQHYEVIRQMASLRKLNCHHLEGVTFPESLRSLCLRGKRGVLTMMNHNSIKKLKLYHFKGANINCDLLEDLQFSNEGIQHTFVLDILNTIKLRKLNCGKKCTWNIQFTVNYIPQSLQRLKAKVKTQREIDLLAELCMECLHVAIEIDLCRLPQVNTFYHIVRCGRQLGDACVCEHTTSIYADSVHFLRVHAQITSATLVYMKQKTLDTMPNLVNLQFCKTGQVINVNALRHLKTLRISRTCKITVDEVVERQLKIDFL